MLTLLVLAVTVLQPCVVNALLSINPNNRLPPADLVQFEFDWLTQNAALLNTTIADDLEILYANQRAPSLWIVQDLLL
jgi:hypothetical protein